MTVAIKKILALLIAASILSAFVPSAFAADSTSSEIEMKAKMKAKQAEREKLDPAWRDVGELGFTLDINWWYAISTLIFRFLMILFMLLVLQVALQISGWYFARRDKAQEEIKAKKAMASAAGGNAGQPSAAASSQTTAGKIEKEAVAAIALALCQYREQEAAENSDLRPQAPVSSWTATSRMMQIQGNQKFSAHRWMKRPRMRKST